LIRPRRHCKATGFNSTFLLQPFGLPSPSLMSGGRVSHADSKHRPRCLSNLRQGGHSRCDRTSSNPFHYNATYISMCGLRGGQNNLRPALDCAAGLDAPKGARPLRLRMAGPHRRPRHRGDERRCRAGSVERGARGTQGGQGIVAEPVLHRLREMPCLLWVNCRPHSVPVELVRCVPETDMGTRQSRHWPNDCRYCDRWPQARTFECWP
jgi:hypothetical protein